MQGRILGFDEAAGTGTISGEDGNRYRLTRAEWKSTTGIVAGLVVDFESKDGEAVDVYRALGAGAPAAAPSAPIAVPTDKLKALFTESLAVPLALIVLIACFMPAITTPIQSASLFGLDSSIGASLGAAASLMGHSSVSSMSSLLVLRFAAPLAALALIMLAWLEKPMQVPMLVAGGVSILVALLVVAFKMAIVSSVESMMGGFGSARAMLGVPSPGSMIGVGIGVWLIGLAGIGLVVAGLGKLQNPLRNKEPESADV
jgi:hypothetical protein